MAKETVEKPLTNETVNAEKSGGAKQLLESILGEDFLKSKNAKIIGAVVGGLLLVGVGYTGYKWMAASAEEEAAKQAAFAMRLFEQDSVKAAIKGTSQWPGLEKIVSEHGSTKTGNQCKILLGNAYYRENQIDKGLEVFNSFSIGKNMPSVSALQGIAYGLEEKGQSGEAADKYLEAAELVPNRVTTPMLYMRAAQAYEAAGEKDEALKLYRKIKTNYPDSEEGRMIDKYLAKYE